MRIYDITGFSRNEAVITQSFNCWYKSSLIIQVIYLISMILWDWNSVFSRESVLEKSSFSGWFLIFVYVSHLLVIQFYFFRFKNIFLSGSIYYLISSGILIERENFFLVGSNIVVAFLSVTNFIISVVLLYKNHQLKKEMMNENTH